ncbi:hypothetical protein GCM10009799_33050 [Nocardiopsis rhodophaea]|uniref:Uncharacterized protein n=1 Tax=Nocardiopsis rhodophaea TaxID=280238 RepID=A0ABP5ERL1_9ACTN
MVTVVATAVLAFGLPTEVKSLYDTGVCRITDGEDCDDKQGASSATDPGDSADGTPEADAPVTNPTAPNGQGDEKGNEDGTKGDTEVQEGDKEGGEEPTDGKEVLVYTQEDADDLLNAYDELNAAETASDKEGNGYDEIYDSLIELVGDIIGYNDAKACITEGDIMACIWTVVGFTPWGKGAKLLKSAPEIIKFWNRFRRARSAKAAAATRLAKARKALDDLKKRADNNRVTRTCPVPSAAGS